MIRIDVCEEFTDAPGPRFKSFGKFSGEEFREDFLIPKLEEAIDKKDILEINLDGTYGYPTSFLEEAFGGLSEHYKFDSELILKHIAFISNDEPSLIEEIKGYITSDERKQKNA